MAKIKGGDLMVFVEGVSIAYATSHTLTVGADTTDTSNKDEGGGDWASSEVNLLNWSATSENLMGAGQGKGFSDLLALMTSKTKVQVAFAAKGSNAKTVPTGGWTGGGAYASGEAYITNLSINAPNGEYATFTVEFTGVGPLNEASSGNDGE